MKIKFHLFLIIVLAAPSATFSQSLNKAGHILLPQTKLDYTVSMVNNVFEIDFQQKKFIGNAMFESANGFISVDGNYENGVSQIYGYAKNGTELFHKKYNQTINIKLSDNKNFAAFYNRGVVVVLNLISFEEQNITASTLFVVHNDGSISYVNTDDNTLHSEGLIGNSTSLVVDVIQHHNTPYFIAKNKIYAIVNNTIEEVYSSVNSIFDFKISNNTFYISQKETNKTEYNFTLIATTNFVESQTIQTVKYPRVVNLNKKHPSNLPEKFSVLDNESILNPMDFASDSSYQAIGNSYNEIQEYSPGDTYLHPGVDLFGTHLQNVQSVKKGFVKAVLTTSGDYHWRVAIANKNTSASSQGYLYAHLDELLIPVTVGDSVEEGEVIGQLVDFPVTGFVHCHFARIVDAGAQWFGSWWTFDNPLYYMENFKDTTAPVFEDAIPGMKVGFRVMNTNFYFWGNTISDEVDIVSKVYDQINTFWKVDMHETGYEIYKKSRPDSMLVSRTSFNFNMFNDTYFSGPYIQDIISTMYARDSTCMSTGNYGQREFYHILTNSNGNDTITALDSTENFNTLNYQNGEYIIKIWAIDAAGNRSEDSMNFFIDNIVGINSDKKSDFSVYPNPSNDFVYIKNISGKPTQAKLCDLTGRVLQEINVDGLYTNVDVQQYPNGLYLLKFENGTLLKLGIRN